MNYKWFMSPTTFETLYYNFNTPGFILGTQYDPNRFYSYEPLADSWVQTNATWTSDNNSTRKWHKGMV